ncbi:AraC family transcriptional regulator [Pedobacter sp. SYP-B3415]|uniref:AraC family transcriptional regulator n=1 Tax=Pedobacter sp. SYP-B3415 TaxID=2496641 RepID=UPI001F0E9746|nr:AraC family transcriptional regulator [Pedobacter sp. SYP-B3415]
MSTMYNGMIREITPLTVHDCFTIFSRVKSEFDFPLHNHEEMELNLILDASGAKRIVGDHIDEIGNHELVFVGSNLPHGWFNHNCRSREIREFTVQFHKDFIDESFLRRNQLSQIRKMFEQAKQGILFSKETVEEITPRILALVDQRGFGSILELLSILHALSNSKNYRTLSDASFTNEKYNFNSRRIEKVFEYMNANFHKLISLADVAKVANMPEASFSRFIKKRTGYSFIDSLNEIRLGHVSRMLIDTTHSVSEIAFKCGFNNMANFNRTFKSKKGCTPKEFRESYLGTRVFV